MRKEKFGTLILEIDDNEKVVAITLPRIQGDKTIRLRQRVKSNGRIFFPAGTEGTVIELHKPFTMGRTTNVIYVVFNSESVASFMKFKDLEL